MRGEVGGSVSRSLPFPRIKVLGSLSMLSMPFSRDTSIERGPFMTQPKARTMNPGNVFANLVDEARPANQA